MLAGQVEGDGHGIGRNVVMRWADPARGEHVVVASTKSVQSFDNGWLIIGDDPHFLQVDARHCEDIGKVPDILVFGATRQELIADGEHGGRNRGGGRGRRHGTILTRHDVRRR